MRRPRWVKSSQTPHAPSRKLRRAGRGVATAFTRWLLGEKKGRLAPALSSLDWRSLGNRLRHIPAWQGQVLVDRRVSRDCQRLPDSRGSSSAETADATARTRRGFLNLRGAGAERARAQSIGAGRLRPNLASHESNNLSEKSALPFFADLRALNAGRLSPAMHVDGGTDDRPDHRWIINHDIPLWGQNCPIHYRHS